MLARVFLCIYINKLITLRVDGFAAVYARACEGLVDYLVVRQ